MKKLELLEDYWKGYCNEYHNSVCSSMLENLEELESDMRKYDVKLPYGSEFLDVGAIRRPLKLIRGKPIMPEQVMQLITGEEPLFGEGSEGKGSWDPRKNRGVLKNIFYRQGYSWLSTWVYSDGTIGGDLISGKYPELDEALWPYLHLASCYPFLDMVVSYTSYNECTCFMCPEIDAKEIGPGKPCPMDCKQHLDEIRSYLNSKWLPDSGRIDRSNFREVYYRYWDTDHVRSDVADSVLITIWIHNGKTDILFGDKAAGKFREYDSLYCAPEYAFMFASGLYDWDRTCICDREFVENCFEYIGKPKELCEEYVRRGFISPFNENAIVVTKKWVTEQYNTYIAGK